MMPKLNLTDDFELLADDLERVTLRYADSSREQFIELASRRESNAQEFTPSGGATVQSDAVWHLQLPSGAAYAKIGDIIVDQQKNRWTVLQIEQLNSLGRCRCTTRELRLANGCHQLADVQRPVWGDNGSGPEIIDWDEVCAALPVSIRLHEMVLDSSTTPPGQQLIYEIVLSDSIDLRPGDRIIDDAGVRYQLQTLEQAFRIDSLPIAKALREETA